MNNLQPMPPFPWQSQAWAGFVENVRLDRLAHAVLLSGDKGAEAFSNAMALYLFCSAPIENVACGKCKDCELFLAGSHPDFHLTTLEEKAKQIKVDQIRHLNEFVAKTAHRERRKIVIIKPASAMNVNASNALLKCLEEPAGDTVFILVQEEQKSPLPTIRSRCSSLELKAPSREEGVEWLKSKGVGDPGEALMFAANSPLLAWEWVQDDSLELRKKVWKSMDEHVQLKVAPLKLLLTWKGLEPKELVSTLLVWLENKIRTVSIGNYGDYAFRAKLFSLRDNIMNKNYALKSSANLNEGLLLEDLAIELQWLSGSALRGLR